MRLGPRTHRALKLTGYVSWALVLFVLFLYRTLPLHLSLIHISEPTRPY